MKWGRKATHRLCSVAGDRRELGFACFSRRANPAKAGDAKPVPDLGAAGWVERLPKGAAMRTTDRVSTAVLSLLVLTVSCSVVPATVETKPAPLFVVDRNPPEAVILAEAAEIARVLRDRDTGLLPAEVVHLSRVIAVEAHAAGLPPAFVLAVIEVESGGRNFAVSEVGARGLMQLLPTTGEGVAADSDVAWRGPETLFDPAANVRLGVSYLEDLIARYANVRIGLAAYNSGPARIARRLRRGESIPGRYADRVLDVYAGGDREI
jgi:hypothetical protein